MSIEEEIRASNDYILEREMFQENELVKLTIDNVAKVEAMICTDSSYSRGTDITAEPEKGANLENKKYKGSSAYWFKTFYDKYKHLNDDDKLEKIGEIIVHKNEKEDIILELVSAIDRENSTHLNADKIGRNEVTNRLKIITKKEFKESLETPEDSNFLLYKNLAKVTNKGEGRINPSFASKFCHYCCLYLYSKEIKKENYNNIEDEKIRDNYSIYDGILREVIGYYANKYIAVEEYEKFKAANKIKKNVDIYISYRKLVDKIIINSKSGISRNGFDHLLWYYHKGRMYELK